MKIAVIYWSGTGNTETMAQNVAGGVTSTGIEVDMVLCTDFIAESVENYSAFAFGCPASGSEELEESEFMPMWQSVSTRLANKPVVLFGSYGWGGGEWLENWKSQSEGLNIVGSYACDGEPDEQALEECKELGILLTK